MSRRCLSLLMLYTAVFLHSATPSLAQSPQPDPELTKQIEVIRAKYQVPALFAAIVHDDQLVAIAATGLRKFDAKEAVTIFDQVHIGSDTKAMTATLLAIMVEEKKLKWESTIGEVLPDLKGKIHADYLGVTLAQMLHHLGGFPKDGDWDKAPRKKTLHEQRLAVLPMLLKDPPENKPGTKFNYSNIGYMLAGTMAEMVTGKTYEELMREKLFKPLGMTSAGFGAPGAKNKVEQPWGHQKIKDKLLASQADNNPLMAAAGTLHCSMPDWAKFARLHLRAGTGKDSLLKPATFAFLHTPPEGFKYAGGWGDTGGGTIGHDGSNTFWLARIRLVPQERAAFLIVTNLGKDPACEVCDDTLKALRKYYEERFRKIK